STQGEIGYLLSQALRECLADVGLSHHVVAMLTHVVVCAQDPAMQHPTKPIGPFLSRTDAEERQRRLGWTIIEDAGRGYRRVVPSPEPLEIVEQSAIKMLLAQGVVVIAAGGGGIPVVREKGLLRGVEAVIDKDRASALLAWELGVERLIISTDADEVYLDFRRPTQRGLRVVTVDQLREYHTAQQFPPGNMGPKIDAALQFLARGGDEVIITSPRLLVDALHGLAGTRIVRS
ncbi:MAG: carbamate kinase, partial [Acidobacteria bacterium]|nr:carbamate kinase [Acidobacteriota bacterium]